MRRESHAKAALERAKGLRGDEEALVALQSAALFAEREGDEPTARAARDSLMYRSHATDRVREQLAAFAWILHTKPDPSANSWEGDTMWTYKWVATNLADCAELSRKQIEGIIEAMAESYVKEGLGTAPIQAVQLDIAIALGDAHESEELFKAWKSNQDNAGADCRACVLSSEVEFLLAVNKLDEALKKAEPLLSREMGCAVVPHTTYAKFLLQLVEAGNLALAGELHGKGMKLLTSLEGCGNTFATHACYLACGYRWEAAFKLLTPRLGTLLRAKGTIGELNSLLAIGLACNAAIAEKVGVATLSLPAAVPNRPADGIWDLTVLKAWADEQAGELASRLDQRNQNTHISSSLSRWRDLQERKLQLQFK